MDKIEIDILSDDEIEETTQFALKEGGCTICGDTGYPIHATGTIGEHDNSDMIFVCSFCMDVGGLGKLEEHAQQLERRAEELRALIGKLAVMPDDQAWHNACKARTTESRRRYLQRLKERGFDLSMMER